MPACGSKPCCAGCTEIDRPPRKITIIRRLRSAPFPLDRATTFRTWCSSALGEWQPRTSRPRKVESLGRFWVWAVWGRGEQQALNKRIWAKRITTLRKKIFDNSSTLAFLLCPRRTRPQAGFLRDQREEPVSQFSGMPRTPDVPEDQPQ